MISISVPIPICCDLVLLPLWLTTPGILATLVLVLLIGILATETGYVNSTGHASGMVPCSWKFTTFIHPDLVIIEYILCIYIYIYT